MNTLLTHWKNSRTILTSRSTNREVLNWDALQTMISKNLFPQWFASRYPTIMSIICISKPRINWWTIGPLHWLVEKVASYCSKKWLICAQIKGNWSLSKHRSKRSNSIMNLARLSMPGTNSTSKRWRNIRQLYSNNSSSSRSYISSSKLWKRTLRFKFNNKSFYKLLPSKQLLQLYQRIPHHWMTHLRQLINSKIINQLIPKTQWLLRPKKNNQRLLLLLQTRSKRRLVKSCKRRSLNVRESNKKRKRTSDTNRSWRKFRKLLIDRGKLNWKRQQRGSRRKRRKESWMSRNKLKSLRRRQKKLQRLMLLMYNLCPLLFPLQLSFVIIKLNMKRGKWLRSWTKRALIHQAKMEETLQTVINTANKTAVARVKSLKNLLKNPL